MKTLKTVSITTAVILGLILGTHVFAAMKGISVVTNVAWTNQTVTKFQDNDTGAICYTASNQAGYVVGISCVNNSTGQK